MAQVNYSEIKNLLAARKPFKGNSMSAELDSDGTYSVFSYDTMIAQVSAADVYINDEHYSTTTSRHQGLVRTYLAR